MFVISQCYMVDWYYEPKVEISFYFRGLLLNLLVLKFCLLKIKEIFIFISLNGFQNDPMSQKWKNFLSLDKTVSTYNIWFWVVRCRVSHKEWNYWEFTEFIYNQIVVISVDMFGCPIITHELPGPNCHKFWLWIDTPV